MLNYFISLELILLSVYPDNSFKKTYVETPTIGRMRLCSIYYDEVCYVSKILDNLAERLQLLHKWRSCVVSKV